MATESEVSRIHTPEESQKTFGDLAIPDTLGGLEWKSMPIDSLVTQFLALKGTLGGLEAQQFMRALVSRISGSERDLESALGLAEAGARNAMSSVIVTALGRIPHDRAVDFLDRLSREGDPESRLLAVLSLSQSGREPYLNVPPERLKTVTSIDPEPAYAVRDPRHGGILLGRLEQERDHKVLAHLITLLGDGQDAPRSSSPPPHEVDHEKVTKLTVEYALHAENADVRRAALSALQHTQADSAIDALTRALTSDPVAGNRSVAAISLCNLPGDDRILRSARHAASDRDENVRGNAAQLLTPSMWPDRRDEILALNIDLYRREGSARVRWWYVGNLGRFGAAGRTYLQDVATNDPDPEIREMALRILAKNPE
ncbi:MAG: HEAT repeat domain-containing protein [Planctomycetes bacterium]|nr:HEAT repeat domain-containing protein [Planctomycetota bacterium]